MKSQEVVLWMEKCHPDRLVPNTVMLCTRNIFLLENMRDIYPDEYIKIIQASGSAGIIKPWLDAQNAFVHRTDLKLVVSSGTVLHTRTNGYSGIVLNTKYMISRSGTRNSSGQMCVCRKYMAMDNYLYHQYLLRTWW